MSIGYITLIRHNTSFRRLWYGQVVSQLGDWFDKVALFTLLLNITGSGQAVGLLLVAEFLPSTLVSPLAGVLIDRWPRKRVMILSDIGRGLLVLALLLIHQPSDIWLIYLVVTLKMLLTAFFEPARSAIIPNLTHREELVTANGLSSATWSAMLAIGAAFGGIVTGTLGVHAAFILDAVSFFLSAALIHRIPFVERRMPLMEAKSTGYSAENPTQTWFAGFQIAGRDLVEGISFIRRHRDILWYTCTKMLWSIAGGILLLLTLFGREIFPQGRDGALSIGLFYAARGVGSGIGPLIAQHLGGERVIFLRRAIGVGFICTALGYLGLSGAPVLALGLLAVLFAHMGGSTQWVFSTALLQMHVPDRLRGRVFAVEYAGMTLTTALSSYCVGLARDWGTTPRWLALGLALLFFVTGVILIIALWRKPHLEGIVTQFPAEFAPCQDKGRVVS